MANPLIGDTPIPTLLGEKFETKKKGIGDYLKQFAEFNNRRQAEIKTNRQIREGDRRLEMYKKRMRKKLSVAEPKVAADPKTAKVPKKDNAKAMPSFIQDKINQRIAKLAAIYGDSPDYTTKKRKEELAYLEKKRSKLPLLNVSKDDDPKELVDQKTNKNKWIRNQNETYTTKIDSINNLLNPPTLNKDPKPRTMEEITTAALSGDKAAQDQLDSILLANIKPDSTNVSNADTTTQDSAFSKLVNKAKDSKLAKKVSNTQKIQNFLKKYQNDMTGPERFDLRRKGIVPDRFKDTYNNFK